jgi:hypothetical protein
MTGWRARRDKNLNWHMFIDSRTYNLTGPTGARKPLWEVMQEHRSWLTTNEIIALVQQHRESAPPALNMHVIRQTLYGLERTGWIERREIGPSRYQWRIGRSEQTWTVQYSLELLNRGPSSANAPGVI